MKNRTSFILFFIFGVVFVAVSLGVFFCHEVQWIDESFYAFISQYQSPLWILMNRWVSLLGQGQLLIVLVFLFSIYLFYKKFIVGALWYLTSILLVMQLNASLKIFFERVRPFPLDPLSFSWIDSTYSYPSGHTLGAVVFYILTLWVFLRINPLFEKKWLSWVVCSLIPILVGVTRITLGVHWFSDVVGGFFLGLSWIFINFVFVKKKALF